MESAKGSSAAVDLDITALEKELQEANRLHGICAEEYNTVRRLILEKKQELSQLEISRHEKSGFMAKARENCKRIESEIRIAKSNFWRLKNEGL